MVIAALLLAAGESRRMGRPKALLPWEGRSLLEYELAQVAASRIDEVVVVLGHRAGELLPLCRGPKVRVVVNPHYRQGPSTSLRAGVAALPAGVGAIVVLRVDQPRPQSLLDALLEAHLTQGSLITIPTYEGRRGHPPIFAPSLLPELAAVREEGQGLREVLRRHAQEVQEVAVDSPFVLLDINRPEDYERARALLKLPPGRC